MKETDESGARVDRASGLVHTVVPLLVIVLFVGAAAHGAKDVANPGVVVSDYEITEGERVFENITTNGYSTKATLNGPASQHGIAKVYIYSNGTELQTTSLEPEQREFGFPGTIHYNTSEIVAYDGSNQVVSRAKVSYDATKGEENGLW